MVSRRGRVHRASRGPGPGRGTVRTPRLWAESTRWRLPGRRVRPRAAFPEGSTSAPRPHRRRARRRRRPRARARCAGGTSTTGVPSARTPCSAVPARALGRETSVTVRPRPVGRGAGSRGPPPRTCSRGCRLREPRERAAGSARPRPRDRAAAGPRAPRRDSRPPRESSPPSRPSSARWRGHRKRSRGTASRSLRHRAKSRTTGGLSYRTTRSPDTDFRARCEGRGVTEAPGHPRLSGLPWKAYRRRGPVPAAEER